MWHPLLHPSPCHTQHSTAAQNLSSPYLQLHAHMSSPSAEAMRHPFCVGIIPGALTASCLPPGCGRAVSAGLPPIFGAGDAFASSFGCCCCCCCCSAACGSSASVLTAPPPAGVQIANELLACLRCGPEMQLSSCKDITLPAGFRRVSNSCRPLCCLPAVHKPSQCQA